MESHTSAARTFFSTYKQLFEYDKHLGGQDPFQLEDHGNGHHSTSTSFLQQYRECDRSELATTAPAHPGEFSSFTLLHPPVPARTLGPLLVDTTAITYPCHPPEFVSLHSTTPMMFRNSQQAGLRADLYPPSPPRASQHTLLLTSFSQPALPQMTHDSIPALQQPSPQRVAFSTCGHDSFSSLAHLDPQHQQYSPKKYQVAPVLKLAPFCMPKLSDLLIDHATRATAVSHKPRDDTHKIEVLIGVKCVGRMNATSRNLPQSVRARLQASANVAARREKLFNLLRRDYEELQQRYRRQ